MLYKFKSPAGADVIMTQGPAELILEVIGKSAGATGIITLEQIPAALAALRDEVQRIDLAKKNVQDKAREAGEGENDTAYDAENHERVDFAQRVVPFVHLLELTQAEGKSVVWGV